MQEEGFRFSRAEVESAYQIFLEILEEALLSGESVGLPGLGVFEVRESPPRPVYDFKEKKTIQSAPQKRVVFRASRKLKALLRGQ